MNKKIIVFICILSLLVPFLPQFDFVVRADVPDDEALSSSENFAQWIDDNFYTDSLGSLRPKSQAPLYLKVNWALTDAGYVLKDPVSAVVDSLQSATNLQLLTKQNLIDYGSTINYDYSTLSQNIVNNTISFAESNQPYYIYRSIPVSKVFTYFHFPKNDDNELTSFKNWLIGHVNNDVSDLCGLYCNYYIWSHATYLIDYSSVISMNSLCLYSGAFNGYQDLQYQSLISSKSVEFDNTIPRPTGNLKFYGNEDLIAYDGFFPMWVNSSSLGQTKNSMSYVGFLQDPYYASWHNYALGTLYISPDSVGSLPFIVFRSTIDMQKFYNGNSDVYKFDSSISLPDSADIDYSRLYDIISNEVQHSSGNVLDAINGVADNYLKQQLDLLHDINNALNDGNGQSWLRRIYGILDYNFPLTLQAFEDLHQAIQNLSISGGGSDLSHINRVLDEINCKLGFMIEEPLNDADIEDMNDLKNLAQQKFPFCVFSDIVAISVILNQTPEEPHWQIPLKLPGSSSSNNIEVDLSWYENVRDLVQGVFIFIFIVGLLALSVKIFSALKS